MKNLVLVLTSNHERSIERVLSALPASLLSDVETEILVVDDDSQDRTFFLSEETVRRVSRGARVRVLRNPRSQGPGASQKLGFRHAIDGGFRRVFVLHGDAEQAPEIVDRLLKEYDTEPAPDAVFAARTGKALPFSKRWASAALTAARNRLLGCRLLETESRYQSFSTAFLARIPFERNSDDMGFHAEMVVQVVAAKAKLIQVRITTGASNGFRGSSGFRYAWRSLLACLHHRLQQMGFLYDPRFDVGENPYTLKDSPFSSHSLLVARVPTGSKVLDVGCGEGWLAEQLTARGCEVDGVDYLPEEAIAGRVRRYHRIDLNRHPEELEQHVRKTRYDLILMGDLIEHLLDPEAFLDGIRCSVPPNAGTRLLVSTGNVAFLIVRLMLSLGQFNYAPRGILDRTHRRLFTIGSFRRLFIQCGYEIRSLTAVPMPFRAVLPKHPTIAGAFERLNVAAAKLWPGLFAYQMIVDAEPLPTASQLFELSESRAAASLRGETKSEVKGDNPVWSS